MLFSRLKSISIAVAIGCVLGLFPVWALCRFGGQFQAIPFVMREPSGAPFPSLSSIRLPWRAKGFETVAPSSTRILFVGDIMLDRKVAQYMKETKDLSYPFRKLPAGWFDTFDYAVANLEGPVTDKRRSPEKSIDFQFDPSVIPVLKQTGLDAFSQANNHALDQGTVGFEDSRARLQAAGFLVFGHQVHDDDIALSTTTVNGLRLAFLGFNTTDNPLDRTAASDVLKNIRTSSDRVIVYMHWGTEYKNRPDASVVETAHWLIDQGVDVVIGGHPHWYQGMESYKGRPIVYSLGNFIFDQYFSKETQQGLAVALTFRKNSLDIEPIPLQSVASQPGVVSGDELKKRREELADISQKELQPAIEAGHVTFTF